jgi:hypothetical protein
MMMPARSMSGAMLLMPGLPGLAPELVMLLRGGVADAASASAATRPDCEVGVSFDDGDDVAVAAAAVMPAVISVAAWLERWALGIIIMPAGVLLPGDNSCERLLVLRDVCRPRPRELLLAPAAVPGSWQLCVRLWLRPCQDLMVASCLDDRVLRLALRLMAAILAVLLGSCAAAAAALASSIAMVCMILLTTSLS